MQFVINNWYLFLALVVVVVLLVAPNFMQQMQGIKNLSPAQSVLLVNRQSGVFIDVGESGEFRAGHVPGSINVSVAALVDGSGKVEKYKERPVVVIGRVGNAALKAATALRKRGFGSVYLMAGGMAAWQKEGLPLEA